MFKIVSSSAGSGKTYTLTKEYLKLALKTDDRWYFKRILAITFTKAATREMKERIMNKLQAFAYNYAPDPMLTDIIHELYPATFNDPQGSFQVHEREIRHRAAHIFSNILHAYSDFSVMTIDSFVQRIVSAFTEELGIPFSFEVEMEADELLLLAVENLLEKAGKDEEKEITELLDDFYKDAGQEGDNWHNLPEVLARFAGDLLQEQRYAAIRKNDDLKPNDFKFIRRQLQQFLKVTENQAIKLGKEGIQIIESKGLESADFSRGTVYKFFQKRTDTNKIFEELGKLETDAFEEEKGWYTKTQRPFIIDSIEEIKPDLMLIYSQLQQLNDKNGAKYVLFKQILPHLYHISLLNQIKAEFDRQLRDNNKVHISEFNQKILQIVTEDPVPFIYERLGEKYNHILIDEFQDTSKLQFANILPLVENSLGYEHFNLAVGDSKQAIYRFRGGDMEQIVGLHTRKLGKLAKSLGDSELTLERLQNISYQLKPDSLTTNRRSARAIIEFNNDFFEQIADNYKAEFEAVGDVFGEDFKQLVPTSASTAGHVQIEFIEKNTNEDAEAPQAMIERIYELVEEAIGQGFEAKDIAILCRRVYDAKNIANYLKDKGFAIVSEDSLSLSFSGAVNLVTAFMRILVRPDDRLKKYEAVYMFYQNVLGKIPQSFENEQIKAAVESNDVLEFYGFINARNPSKNDLEPYKLLQLTTYELAERLMMAFDLFELSHERDYLFKFLDVMLEYGTQKGNHLNDFVDFWDKKRNKTSISSPSEAQAITIQTIHKSKGLEYPVVIVPYAHWSFTPDAKKDTIWLELEPSEELKTSDFVNDDGLIVKGKPLKTASSKTQTALAQTPQKIAKQYAEEVEKTLLDNLNLLYVAFTRPTQRLYVLANHTKFETQKNPSRISYWLYLYLTQIEKWQDGQMTYVLTQGGDKQASKHGKEEQVLVEKIQKLISNDRSRDMRLRRLADRIFDVETFERKKDHGNKVHRALEFVRSPEDVETAIRKLQIEGLTEPSEADEIRKSIDRILQHPDLQGLFHVETSARNEREILTPDGNMHRPDRVVQLQDRTIILDYKTGNPSDSHQTQIRRYMKLYKDMGFDKIEGKLVYIELNEVLSVN